MEERPSWHEYFFKLVQLTSTRSPCKRLQVGCILVKDNRMVSQGYNGFLPILTHNSIIINDHEIAPIHAEQNALIDCAKRGVSCENCIAYITHYPCIHCAKLLYSANIRKIYYIHDYKNSEYLEKIGLFQNKDSMSITKVTI